MTVIIKEATRAQMVERSAKALSKRKFGHEGFWTIFISQASQAIAEKCIKKMDA